MTVTRVGNQKHYQANAKAPVFGELRSLILKTSGIADPIREALRPLARRIDLALIYGSVARGEAHAGSDVDLLVVSDDLLLEQLYARILAAEKALGRRISPTLYTSDEFRKQAEQLLRAEGPCRAGDPADRNDRCRSRNSIVSTWSCE